MHPVQASELTLALPDLFEDARVFGRSAIGCLRLFSTLTPDSQPPTRRAILARLALGEATVMEIAKPFEMSQPAVSRHLKVLEGAGLIVRRVEGTKRPCRLAKAGVDAIDDWLAMLRSALVRNYDRLDQVLADIKPKDGEKT